MRRRRHARASGHPGGAAARRAVARVVELLAANGEASGQRLPPWLPLAAAVAVSLAYLVALALWRDSVPRGLNNDAAEEALRGIQLLQSGRFEVMSSSLGIPQETLYLYLVAAVTRIFGTTTLAIQVVSWLVALGCLWLTARLARRIDAHLPPWVAWLVAGSSIWLFHYGRAGVRAISAPLFLLAVALLLDRAERRGERAAAVACGAVLGLGLYAYTSCRVLVLALIAHAAVRVYTRPRERRQLAHRYGWMAAAALLVSIPNLLFLIDQPRVFLLRGSYVVRGGLTAIPGHLLWSFLLPFFYPDRYRDLAGATHIFDGVSAGLTAAGIDPLHPIATAAFVLGLVPVWRRRGSPLVSFLIAVWLAGTVALGISGPSLTRFLILLPIYLAVAAVGAGTVLRRVPSSWRVVAALLLLLLGAEVYAYFVTFARDDVAQQYFSPAATPMGERARALARQGERVVCVVAKDANVVSYLTHDYSMRVHVVEFYRRPLEPSDIPLVNFQAQVLLLERSPRFAAFRKTYFGDRHIDLDAAFDEFLLE